MLNNFDSYIIDTNESFNELKQLVFDNDYKIVSLDLETDSVNEQKAKIYGIGIAFESNVAYYLPIRHNDTSMFWPSDIQQSIFDWVTTLCNTYNLIGWNLSYDTLVWEYNTGYTISHLIHTDCMLLKHLINEERPFGLKEVAKAYLGDWADKAKEKMAESVQANGGEITQKNFEMFKADTEVLGEYCCWDVLLTRQLYELFEPELDKQRLRKLFYEEEVMPLYREVTIPMKRRGFTIDMPYFEDLLKKITGEISTLQDKIMTDIAHEVEPFEKKLLDRDYPIRRAGMYPKLLAELVGVSLPIKDEKITMNKKVLLAARKKNDCDYYTWLLDEKEVLKQEILLDAQRQWYFANNSESKYVFNLKSNDHLGWLFFEHLGAKPLSKTEGGKPQCDDEFLLSVKDKYPFVAKLIDLKKLNKLSATYIEGIMESATNGIVHCSFLQHGTTSGRYSATNPNLQNLPRVKDDDSGLSELVLHYVNSIKKGFVAPRGYKIINADYSSLEPVCFAHASGDEKLREVFRKGYDLYSAIAIEVFGITGCSANKKDPNYLKNKYPELRQKAKVIALAVVYGAEANRISDVADIDYKAAEEIIESYLDAYPQLRDYMQRMEYGAKKNGFVVSDFGRIRHLPQAKSLYASYGDKLLNRAYVKKAGLSDTRYMYKNALNNAKNFPIQCLAAHIVNRALIRASRLFVEHKIEGGVVAMVHDEICCVAREDQSELAKTLLRDAMENTTTISVPLKAEPIIGNNWSECK